MNNTNYLPHITNSLPPDVVGRQTSLYPIALEGWRRGLKLKFHNNKRAGEIPALAITYSLSDEGREHHFACARGSLTSKGTIEKVMDKTSAYKHMKKKGVPIPETNTFNFSKSSIEGMLNYGDKIGYPLVIKPTNLAGGKGVVTDIKSREALSSALKKTKNNYNTKNIIIEKYFENGSDFRFYVIKDKVIAACKFYSSNVVGDGESTLEQLINKRNVEIKNNVAAKNKIIKIDNEMLEYLSEKKMSLNYVPKEGKRIFVRRHGTHLAKRLSVDCTETIDPKFKKYAVDALNSVHGLLTGSIDMIINEETNEAVVNEINTRGEVWMHIFPFEGEAVDIPKHLIDFYFPGSQKINNKFYFEYKPVKDLFLDGYADEITIPMYPENTQYKKEYVIEFKNFDHSYLENLKRKAARLHLKGSIQSASGSRLEIITIGSYKSLKIFENILNKSIMRKSNIYSKTSSDVEKFSGVSTIGFEIITNG